MKKQNIIAALLIGALVGFFGYQALDNNTSKITDEQSIETATEIIEEDNTELNVEVSEENKVDDTELKAEEPESKIEETINSIMLEDTGSVSDNSLNEDEENRLINEANPDKNEYIICVIRKNNLDNGVNYDIVSNTIAKNHYIGLVTLKMDNGLIVDAEITEDNTVKTDEETDVDENISIEIVEEYAGVDVNNLELGKYYFVVASKDIEKGPVLTISSIRDASEYEIKNFELGRIQNSTFTTDFEQLKLMEPKEALEKSLTMQYTWSFEQIEIFKAYIESEKATSEELKKVWEEAEKEIDLDLGY